MKSIIVVFAVLAVGAGSVGATLGMSPVSTHYITGLTGIVEQVWFNDSDNDGLSEVLMSDGSRVILHRLSDGVTVFEAAIDTRTVSYDLLYEDVNRDHIPDILIGQYFENGTFTRDTVCRVDMYDGASGYVDRETVYFKSVIDFAIGIQPLLSFVDFSCHDVDGDGYKEVFISYYQCRLWWYMYWYYQNSTGQTWLYSDFPGTGDSTGNILLRDITPLEITGQGPLYIASHYSSLAIVPSSSTSTCWAEIVSSEGDSLGSIGELNKSICHGDSTRTKSYVEFMCVGDIGGEGATDVLVRYHFHQTSYDNDAVACDVLTTNLRLYRINAPDDIAVQWADVTPEITANFYYSPEYPGYFFGATGGTVYKFSGLNGDEIEVSETIDADTIIWQSGANLPAGDFVAIKNQTLRIYELGTTTDTPDDDQMAASPERFTLSNAHPNPFNASCVIEYSLPYRSHATIDIYNILGRKIATLVDASKPAGSHVISWDGRDRDGKQVSSGVYLYRLTAGDYVDSKKVVLVK